MLGLSQGVLQQQCMICLSRMELNKAVIMCLAASHVGKQSRQNQQLRLDFMSLCQPTASKGCNFHMAPTLARSSMATLFGDGEVRRDCVTKNCASDDTAK